jgi:hypothetical protein
VTPGLIDNILVERFFNFVDQSTAVRFTANTRTQEVPLHPVKVGVWCAVSARRIIVPVFLNETINCEKYLRAEGQYFQHLL